MDRSRMEVINAIELMFANSQLAKAAALSEVNSFFEVPSFRTAVKAELGISNDREAAITWATRRGDLWRPFDNASLAREPSGVKR